MPDFYSLFLKYFWFVGVAFGLLNFFNLRNRIQQAVAKNLALQDGASAIVSGCLFFLTVPYLALGILQTLGGYDTALFFYYAPLTDPIVWLAYAVPLLCTLFLSYWVLQRGGAEKMVAYGLSNGTERTVRLFFGLSPIIVILALAFGRFFLGSTAFSAAP